MSTRATIGSGWKRFRRLPGWGQVVIAVLAASVAVAPFGNDDKASVVRTGAAAPQAEDEATTSTSESTTTTTSTTTSTTTTTTTTTTVAPTTTVARPTTTAKPATTTTRRATTTTAPKSSASGCHSSYTRTCIPPDVSDADCAGGSGNGPYYVKEKNIGVVGPDVFDLDRDGDGVGCES